MTAAKSDKSDMKFGLIRQASAQHIELCLATKTRDLEIANAEIREQKSQI